MHLRPLSLPLRYRRRVGVCAALMSLWTMAAYAGQSPTDIATQQPRIAFASLGGIRDWRASGNDVLYVQSRNRRWYRAELFAPCIGLTFANAIGINVQPGGSFDRFSSVIVDGHECHLRSLEESDPPSSGQRGRSGEAADAAAGDAAAGAKVGDGRPGQSAAEAMRIAFADLGGIQSWQVVDESTLFIEGRNRRWYRAELFSACPGLRSQTDIGFVLESGGDVDRIAALRVNGRECRVKSLTAKDTPPPRH